VDASKAEFNPIGLLHPAGAHRRGDMPGRIREKLDQVVGIYESRFDNGHARLKLKADGTYFHEFSLAHRSIRHTDRCETKNYFLDGDGS